MIKGDYMSFIKDNTLLAGDCIGLNKVTWCRKICLKHAVGMKEAH